MNTLLRLSNGVQTASQYSGRVEVYNQGQWGTVCSNGFDNNDAQAICNMFKYKYVFKLDSIKSNYKLVYHTRYHLGTLTLKILKFTMVLCNNLNK